jgi:ammonia channel protein AmtB
MENKEEKYVTLKIFTWVIGVIVVVFGWLFAINSALSSKVDSVTSDSVVIQTQLAQIQADLVWIKNNLRNNK